ncbi:MAG: DUF6873 family GME fold protein [Acutalibacteraceae bacterium]
MIKFVKSPNLPKNNIKTVICGTNDETILNYTKSLGIEIIQSDLNLNVDERIAAHTDISVHHLKDNCIICDNSQQELIQKLRNTGMKVIISQYERSSDKKYPFDCALNFTRISDCLIGKQTVMCQELNQYAKSQQLKLIHVNQGYCKCSTSVIDKDAFITDDISIYKAGIANGFDCLYISKGSVRLKEFDYGFIGGACVKTSKNNLLFFGDITKHDDFNKIDEFLKRRNCSYDFIKDYPLTDIGGMIPIIEF